MDIQLQAERAKDGRIFVYFMDGQLSEYRVCVAVVEGKFIMWEGEGGVSRKAIV